MADFSKGAAHFLKKRGLELIRAGEEPPLLIQPGMRCIDSNSEEYRHACEVVGFVRMGEFDRKRALSRAAGLRLESLTVDIDAELPDRFVYIALYQEEQKLRLPPVQQLPQGHMRP